MCDICMIALYRCDTPRCDAGPWPVAEHVQYTKHNNSCNVEVLQAMEKVKEAREVLEEATTKLRLSKVKIVIT